MKSSGTALAIFTFLLCWMLSPAQAQQRDRCADSASGMVSNDQRARQLKCPGWTSHSDYNHHYAWCQARTPQQVQQTFASWQTRFQSCQFAAGGSPVAQADATRCAAYGDEMVRLDQMARAKQCRGWNSHANRNRHIQWCQVQAEAGVNRALADWRNRYKAC